MRKFNLKFPVGNKTANVEVRWDHATSTWGWTLTNPEIFELGSVSSGTGFTAADAAEADARTKAGVVP